MVSNGWQQDREIIDALKRQGSWPCDLPYRGVCPICKGGSDREATLTLNRDYETGEVWARCWRDKCDVKPHVIQSLSNRRAEAREVKKKPEEKHAVVLRNIRNMHVHCDLDFVRHLCPAFESIFDSEDYARDRNRHTSVRKYLLNPRMWRSDRYVMPMYDLEGEIRGGILKVPKSSPEYNKPGIPKALTYKEEGYDGLGWYVAPRTLLDPNVWVVEDGLSALVLLLHGQNAVSLNGTNLSPDRMDTIRAFKENIFLALDADATGTALNYAKKYMFQANMIVQRMTKDFKDMNSLEVQRTIEM